MKYLNDKVTSEAKGETKIFREFVGSLPLCEYNKLRKELIDLCGGNPRSYPNWLSGQVTVPNVARRRINEYAGREVLPLIKDVAEESSILRSYFYSLTAAERNSLRIALSGHCGVGSGACHCWLGGQSRMPNKARLFINAYAGREILPMLPKSRINASKTK
ncbi:MAG: hypothetical protein K2H87_02065 [Duncaniella sp.]|nr:hypothetical protein [Duncaniella sp.]